jgi:hypothetical protein
LQYLTSWLLFVGPDLSIGSLLQRPRVPRAANTLGLDKAFD